MAWEWSHSAEGYANLRANLARMDRETLCCMLAEFDACPDSDAVNPDFNAEEYGRRFTEYCGSVLYTETLAESVFERMEQLRTCTNGGGEAWGCPYGCSSHLVSFSAKGEEVL